MVSIFPSKFNIFPIPSKVNLLTQIYTFHQLYKFYAFCYLVKKLMPKGIKILLVKLTVQRQGIKRVVIRFDRDNKCLNES